jgi:hypothetical protein
LLAHLEFVTEFQRFHSEMHWWDHDAPDDIQNAVHFTAACMWLCVVELLHPSSMRMIELQIAIQTMCEWSISAARVVSQTQAEQLSRLVAGTTSINNIKPVLVDLPPELQRAVSDGWVMPNTQSLIDQARWAKGNEVFSPFKAHLWPMLVEEVPREHRRTVWTESTGPTIKSPGQRRIRDLPE